MPASWKKAAIRLLEIASYACGALLTAFFVVQLAQGEVQRRTDVANFESTSSVPGSGSHVLDDGIDPDTSLWSSARIADYQQSLKAELPPLMGVLEIPSVGLKVPVYSTDNELTLDRGAGIIDGMSYPHEPGNIGISGHRDGYFRALKDVKPGDELVLQTLTGQKIFRVSATQVVESDDTKLLQDTREQSVTLVTCYPFYFVGPAPQRFIVTASPDLTYVNLN